MTNQGYHKTQADHCVFVKKFEGGDFLILLLYVDDMLIVGRHQAQDTDAEEGSQSNLRDERLGSGKTDTGDAHHPGPVKEPIVAVTGEIRDKSASAVQHVGSKTGRIDTASILQIIR